MKIKEVNIFIAGSQRVTFLVGEKILVNGMPSNQTIIKIKTSLFKKAVYIYLSDGEILKYNGFPYIVNN